MMLVVLHPQLLTFTQLHFKRRFQCCARGELQGSAGATFETLLTRFPAYVLNAGWRAQPSTFI